MRISYIGCEKRKRALKVFVCFLAEGSAETVVKSGVVLLGALGSIVQKIINAKA